MLSAVKDTPSAMLSAVKDTPSAMLSAVKDGMDIALCSININTHELQFAGANNSLYIIKPAISHSPLAVGQGTPEANSQQLIELKGDKMPIGIHERMDNFTLQTIQLVNGDRLYMMSDGMSDQFGGPSGKKFLSRNIKNILTKTADYTIDNQRIYIENEINNWIGNPSGHYEQIDDITIFGIHF
jgi:serine phosphatase RsbU (regulator of sigma subunit)